MRYRCAVNMRKILAFIVNKINGAEIYHVIRINQIIDSYLLLLADCTARSMIGFWHDTECLSVCLSVCDAVHCGTQGRSVQGVESLPSCSS